MQIFFLTIAANSSSDKQREGTREELEGLQSNFYKASLSAGKLQHITAEKKEGNKEKYDILSGLHGCKDRGAEAGICTFWLFSPPFSTSKHTLCFIVSVVLPLQQESATVVNAFPKKGYILTKRLAHSRRHELF